MRENTITTQNTRPAPRYAPRQARRPASWYGPALLTGALFTLAPLLSWLEVISPFYGFAAFVSSIVAGAISIIWGVWLTKSRRLRQGLVSIGVGLVPVVFITAGTLSLSGYPRIRDISTDLDSPPAFVVTGQFLENQGRDLRYPEELKDAVREFYPELISLQMNKPARQVFAELEAMLTHWPQTQITRVDKDAMIIEATVTSRVFRFKDDVVIRVQNFDDRSQVDMRSRSRSEGGDFGTNAMVIREVLSHLSNGEYLAFQEP